MELREYVRKPFPVKAIQVTNDNMAEIAAWCGGAVFTVTDQGGDRSRSFIRVPVFQARTERQGQAFRWDWVTEDKGRFKVYTDNAFRSHFEAKQPDTSPNFLMVADGQTVLEIPEGI